MNAKKQNTVNWYANTPNVWKGSQWTRKVDYVDNCKWCGSPLKLSEGQRFREYCPRPKSCRELAYQKRKRNVLLEEK